MLPTFPKTQKILDKAWNKEMYEAKDKIFPLEIHPPVHPINEGKQADFQRDDGQVKPFEMKLHQTQLSRSIEHGKGMTLDEFHATAKECGEAMGKKFFESMVGVINEAVKETGNEIKIKKGDLKQEDLLQMMETAQYNFDEAGKPTGQLVCSPEFAQELEKREAEWKDDKDFLAKIEEVKTRKKAEFDEREARRRLVD